MCSVRASLKEQKMFKIVSFMVYFKKCGLMNFLDELKKFGVGRDGESHTKLWKIKKHKNDWLSIYLKWY